MSGATLIIIIMGLIYIRDPFLGNHAREIEDARDGSQEGRSDGGTRCNALMVRQFTGVVRGFSALPVSASAASVCAPGGRRAAGPGRRETSNYIRIG
jgi:hypothetical protein